MSLGLYVRFRHHMLIKNFNNRYHECPEKASCVLTVPAVIACLVTLDSTKVHSWRHSFFSYLYVGNPLLLGTSCSKLSFYCPNYSIEITNHFESWDLRILFYIILHTKMNPAKASGVIEVINTYTYSKTEYEIIINNRTKTMFNNEPLSQR